MNAHTTALRFASAAVLATLLVLGMVPAASAQESGQPDGGHGWEQTSAGEGKQAGGSVSAGPGGSAISRHGWEQTSVATGTGQQGQPVASSPQPVTPSPTLLYVAAIVAGLAMAFGVARMLRSHDSPTGVA